MKNLVVTTYEKEKAMFNNMEKCFTIDLLYLFFVIFMILYLNVTKNLLDVLYLGMFSSYYFKIKYSRWKKYH